MGAIESFALGAIAVAAVSGYLLWRARREAARLRDRLEASAQDLQRLQLSFGRFAPGQVVERVIARGVDVKGEKKEVTILFADLVGFTALSEQVDPTTLVRILNGYFERMSRAIKAHRGHVATFIGDGILALFGALEANPWQGNDAVHSALAMRDQLNEYNHELEADGHPALAIGIGLHRGFGVAGLVGSRDLMEFTVVGKTINLASRVQDLTRLHDASILVTEDLQRTLDPRFVLRPLPPAEVRGIAEPVRVFAVEGFDDGASA